AFFVGDERERYIIEHNRKHSLRMDEKQRAESYALGRQWGWYSVNDIRRLENENPIENGDRYLEPVNMVEAGAEPPAPEPAPTPIRRDDAARAHYAALLQAAAERIVRREAAQVAKLAQRHAGDADAWRTEVAEFYAAHAAFVAETLRVRRSDAAAYCGEQRDALLANGAAVMADWETVRVTELVALVLGRSADAA
ncbi:MAG TPA: hypothetical protein VEA38_04915, partial [Terriglobales bacterium]|nr:hypothetical protein [Terriglobales bacterium]